MTGIPPDETMRAAYLDELGPPEVIRYGELPRPAPGPGEVLVEVEVTTVNWVDTFVRSGAWRTPLPFPFVIGRDLAGVVAAPGPGFDVGDRVWCNSLGHHGRQGAAAEYAVVPSDRLYHLPAGVRPADAVTVAHPAATAYLALFTHGRMRAGETVLVVGAGGNVGGAAVLMAADAGARVVAVAREHDAADCRALGAAEVLDYTDPLLREHIRDVCPQGIDLYVDTAGRNDLTAAVDLLAHRGRVVVLAGLTTTPVLPVGPLYLKDCSVVGFAISQASAEELAEAAVAVNRLLASGALRPRRTESLPLHQAGEAHRRMERGELHGTRLVLHVRPANLTNRATNSGPGSRAADKIASMSESVIDNSPLFDLSADIPVAASPEQVYAVVSDLPRSGEWSPECQGGTWIEGEPSQVGSVFRGENFRAEDVVGWAPLVRGTWHTECRVVTAEPGRSFAWMMLSHAGADQESVWGFDIRPAEGGSVLTHRFRMGKATAGIHKIVADLGEVERKRFVVEWTAKLEHDLDATLKRIKEVIERG